MTHPRNVVPAHRLRAQAQAAKAAKPSRKRARKPKAGQGKALVDKIRDGEA